MDNLNSSDQGGSPPSPIVLPASVAPAWHSRMPFPGAYQRIVSAKAALNDTLVPPCLVLALCQRESMCNPFFCKCDMLFKTNLSAVVAGAGVSSQEFLSLVTVRPAGGPPVIGKWRFEKLWWDQINANPRLSKLSPAHRALLACSLGIGQKWALAMVERMSPAEWLTYLNSFISDPAMQLIQVI